MHSTTSFGQGLAAHRMSQTDGARSGGGEAAMFPSPGRERAGTSLSSANRSDEAFEVSLAPAVAVLVKQTAVMTGRESGGGEGVQAAAKQNVLWMLPARYRRRTATAPRWRCAVALVAATSQNHE